MFVTAFLMQFAIAVYRQSSASHTVRIIAHPILELKLDEQVNNTDFSFNSLSDYENGKSNIQAAGL